MSETPPGGVRATAVAYNAETAIVFIPGPQSGGPTNVDNPVPPAAGPSNVIIRGVANMTSGGTNTTVKCRRGNGVGGAQVGTSQIHTTVAASPYNIPIEFQDLNNPNPQAGYTITFTGQAAGTANEIVASIDDGT